MKSNLFIVICLLSFFEDALNASCLSLPETQTQSPDIVFCEMPKHYYLSTPEQEKMFLKTTFQNQLQEALESSMELLELPISLCESHVKIWLTVAAHHEVRLKIAIYNGEVNLLATSKIPFDGWVIPAEDIAGLLPGQQYPARNGFRLGSFLIKKAQELDLTELKNYLFPFELKFSQSINKDWHEFTSPLLKENVILKRVERDFRSRNYIESITLDEYFEWITDKAQAAAFDWHCER